MCCEGRKKIPWSEVYGLKCLSVLYDVSVDYLLNEELEQPDRGEDIANVNQTEGKWWSTKNVVISLLFIVVAVVAVTVTIHSVHESKITSIHEMEREGAQGSSGIDFDIEW